MIAFGQGFLIGLATILFMGPVFFTLMQASLQHGKSHGLAVAIGIFISDVAAATICGLFAKRLFKLDGEMAVFRDKSLLFYIGILAMVILVALGLMYLFRPKANFHVQHAMNSRNWWNYFVRGFLVNFVNPFVFTVWAAIILTYRGDSLILYLSGVLIGILVLDVGRVTLAEYIRPLLKPVILIKIYRVFGIALIVSGIVILLRVSL